MASALGGMVTAEPHIETGDFHFSDEEEDTRPAAAYVSSAS